MRRSSAILRRSAPTSWCCHERADHQEDLQSLEPVQEHEGEHGVGRWTRRLVLFLRVMAGVSMLKGLYHWSQVCGIGVDANDGSKLIRSPGRPPPCSLR